jgi:YD repeat-containing protein
MSDLASDAILPARGRRRGGLPVLGRRAGLGLAVCVALAVGLVSPVWAAGDVDGDADGVVQSGSFGLGDGLEATIDESQGAFGFTVEAGGLQLAWDSRAIATDRHGFGAGWALGLAAVRISGGVLVFPSSGGAFEADRSSPTGLAGYPGADVVFEFAEPGAELPERGDRAVPSTEYASVLHELGGTVTYFDADGDPVAREAASGDRTDWRWAGRGSHRLVAAVSADGAVTSLDWSDDGSVVVVPGANVSHPLEGSGVGGEWRVEVDRGRLSAVVDPVGGRTEVGYRPDGLVRELSTPSGAATQVSWRSSLDAVARVEQVRVVDRADGTELSRRAWSGEGVATPTGWPVVPGSGLGDASVEGTGAWLRETALSDGPTRVVSEFDGRHRMTRRATIGSTSSGDRLLQEQSFEYPARDDAGAAAPGGASGGTARTAPGAKPIAVTVRRGNDRGEHRDLTESYGFDELGRMVSRTSADGTTTTRVYDDAVPPGRRLPVGLVVEETTTATDGLVSSTRHELHDDRAAVSTTERWDGRDTSLTRTTRAEYDVEDGFVREQRVYAAGDPAATPVVTRWAERLDLAAGTKTVTETVAAGTELETSASSVSSLVHGGALRSTDELGRTMTATFDEAGRPVSADAAGRVATRSYRSVQTDGENSVTVTGVDGVSVTQTHDALGRVTSTADDIGPAGAVVEGHERVIETREYDGSRVERVTDAWGATTTTERDVLRPAEPRDTAERARADRRARRGRADRDLWHEPDR